MKEYIVSFDTLEYSTASCTVNNPHPSTIFNSLIRFTPKKFSVNFIFYLNAEDANALVFKEVIQC